jgi:hypothetical protein
VAGLSLRRNPPSLPRTSPIPARKSTLVMTGLLAHALGSVVLQSRLAPLQAVPLACALAMGAAALWFFDLRRSDSAAFSVTLGSIRFRWLLNTFAPILFVETAAGYGLIPLAERNIRQSAGEIGGALGTLAIAGGITGALGGGWVGDRWNRRDPRRRTGSVALAITMELDSVLYAVRADVFTGFLAGYALL